MKKNFYEIEPLLKPIHGGRGVTRSVKLYEEHELSSDLKYVSYSQLEPESSIGYHVHDDLREEIYTILDGQGTMTIDDESFEVKTGDVILTPPGSGHGLVNNGDRIMNVFIFWVKAGDHHQE